MKPERTPDMDTAKKPFWHYAYFTDDVAARARDDELLQELVLAVVNITADYDMSATGKLNLSSEDHADSYHYFRIILEQLGIPPQAILDIIDGCFPDDDRDNLTERDAVDNVEAEIVTDRCAEACAAVP
jgi:hypothetical protein